MIYVTGDLHGDLTRFKSKEFKKIRRKDTLIVCGDFGFLWDGSKKEQKILTWLGKRKYTLLFIEGAHDNLNLLEGYPITSWNGGKVREITGKLRYLCRGSVFTLEEQKIFAFGGGESDSPTVQWADKQLPTETEVKNAWKNLERVDFKVDHIITHQSSRKIKLLLTMEENDPSVLDMFLDKVRDRCEYSGWCFGSFHKNRVIPPKEIVLFDAVIPLLKTFDMNALGNSKKKFKKLRK